MTAIVPHRQYLTIPETAEQLRVSERTIRRLIWRAELPALRVGSQIRIDSDQLANWLYSRDGGRAA